MHYQHKFCKSDVVSVMMGCITKKESLAKSK